MEFGDPAGLARYALWVVIVKPDDALRRFGRLGLFVFPPPLPPTVFEESNMPPSDWLKGECYPFSRRFGCEGVGRREKRQSGRGGESGHDPSTHEIGQRYTRISPKTIDVARYFVSRPRNVSTLKLHNIQLKQACLSSSGTTKLSPKISQSAMSNNSEESSE